MRTLHLAFAVLATLGWATAQNTLQVPLAYNWNGIAHVGETGIPDAPNGFRSISDRALDFTAGLPADPVLARYAIVAAPGVLDMVHLGNRNTVDNGNWAFDPFPDNDNIGVQPSWLASVNQTGPQVTVLPVPVTLGLTSSASVLFHVSNGGGSCNVTFTYQSSNTTTRTIAAPDWFGGTYAGRDSVDRANPGANLNLAERIVDLSADAGEVLVQIAFSNRSNTNGGYGIYGVNVEAAPTTRRDNRITLAYNWNGIAHSGESGMPDAPNGYRSIADRGLDFRTGVPNTPLLAEFDLVDTPASLDLVMLGNRNTVAGGIYAFDPAPGPNNIGVQPNWLPNVDLTGPQTTQLPTPILLDAGSTVSLLYQISNGGGAFDVTFTFQTGSITSTVTGGDWVGGSFLGVADVDRANTGLPLRIDSTTISLGAAAGLALVSITFENRSNQSGSYAILAANVSGCLACGNSGGAIGLGGGNGPTMATTSTGALGCALDWTVTGATPNTPLGFFAVGLGSSAQPLASFFPACSGTIHVLSPVIAGAMVGGSGSATYTVVPPADPSFCGLTLTSQYAEFVAAGCPLLLSDGLAITIGN